MPKYRVWKLIRFLVVLILILSLSGDTRLGSDNRHVDRPNAHEVR